MLTTVVAGLSHGYEQLKNRVRESRVGWCVGWWTTDESAVAKPLFVAFLFAGLGLWFVLSLPSHAYMAGCAAGIAVFCVVCLRD
jgi:hypothetical protein